MAKKTGRPTKNINLPELDKLCRMQCTVIEVAAWFDVSVDTVEKRVKEATGRRFTEYFEEKRGAGKAALRRRQWQKAMTGNPTMLIWLGKQYLEQKDKQELTGKDGGPLTILFAKELQGV